MRECGCLVSPAFYTDELVSSLCDFVKDVGGEIPGSSTKKSRFQRKAYQTGRSFRMIIVLIQRDRFPLLSFSNGEGIERAV